MWKNFESFYYLKAISTRTTNGWDKWSCSMQKLTSKGQKNSMRVKKKKSADIQCLNKRLLYDYSCYTHKPLALRSNDVKSCYDHIVLIITALCLCCLGAPKTSVQSMVSTIHGMQHHIWEFQYISRMSPIDRSNCRNRSR